MLKRPQMVDGLEDIVKDYKLKLPNRQWTQMWNSPQFQFDRDMTNMEMLAKKQQNARILHEEVIETARDTNTNFPDVNHIAQAIQGMTAMGAAQQQAQDALHRANAQQQAQQAQETRAMLQQMAAEMVAQRSRDKIADEVSRLHQDAMFADIRSRQEAMAAAGGVTNHNYDQTSSTTNNNTYNSYDQSTSTTAAIDPNAEINAAAHRNMIYNMVQNFMKEHHEQFAAFATQNELSAARALAALTELIEKQHLGQSQVNATLVGMLANPANQSQYNQGPPPTPPPTAAPVAAPMVASTPPVQAFHSSVPIPTPVAAAPVSMAALHVHGINNVAMPMPKPGRPSTFGERAKTTKPGPGPRERTPGRGRPPAEEPVDPRPVARPKSQPPRPPPIVHPPSTVRPASATRSSATHPPPPNPMELQTLGKRATSSGLAANKRPNRNSTPQPPRAKSKAKSPQPGDGTLVAQAPVVAKPQVTAAAQSRAISAASGAQNFDIAGSRGRAPSTGKSRSKGKSVPPVKEIAAAVTKVVDALEANGSAGAAPAAVVAAVNAAMKATAKAAPKKPNLKKVLEPKKAPKKVVLAVPGTRKTRQKQSFGKEFTEKVPAVRMKSGKITVDRAALRAKITRISSGIAAAKTGRGRPPGSLNKKTLLAREALQAQAVA